METNNTNNTNNKTIVNNYYYITLDNFKELMKFTNFAPLFQPAKQNFSKISIKNESKQGPENKIIINEEKINNNRILRLSYDDRVSDRKEKERIIKQGGIIFNGRIYGQLMLSRCFGDWSIKEYGVIVLPHVARIELTSDDLYLILATDGVWDVLSDDDIVKLTQINSNSLGICKNIVIESLNRESEDNISCFVISL